MSLPNKNIHLLESISQENKANIRRICDQLKTNIGLIPFVGAGLSIPYGFPAWSNFLLSLSQSIGLTKRIKQRITAGEFEEAAEDLFKALGSRAFDDALDQAYGDDQLTDKKLDCAMALLPQLAQGSVITTNFDHALENVFQRACCPFEYIVWGARSNMVIKGFHQNRRFLLKIHGDVEDHSDRILTLSEYKKNYGSIDDSEINSNRDIPRLLELMLTSRPLLFLGCSLTVDRTVLLLSHIAKKFRGIVHYAVVEMPNDESKMYMRLKQLSEHGIRPIWYPNGQHDLIVNLIRYLVECIPIHLRPCQAPMQEKDATEDHRILNQESPLRKHRNILDETDKNFQEQFKISLDLDPPPSQSLFVGRTAELTELETLTEKNSALIVEGLSGIGKTSLVLMLAKKWLISKRISPEGFFYFDCSQRNMRLKIAGESLLRNLSTFLNNNGNTDASIIVSNEEQQRDQRLNTLSTALSKGRYLLFLDNFQDALDDNRRISSPQLAYLLNFLISRSIGSTRFIFASYVQCSWSGRIKVYHFRLHALSQNDARSLLVYLGVKSIDSANKAAELVERHPQAIRWFSILPVELGLSVEELIDDLTAKKSHETTSNELYRRIDEELLHRIWETMPSGARHFLSLCTVFRRPVPFEALKDLTLSPDVDQWRQVLLDRFLILATSRDGPHSLHAIVREFAKRQLNSKSADWTTAHQSAAKWWRKRCKLDTNPTRTEIEAAVEEHFHLVSAGDVDLADEVANRLRPILMSAGLKSYRQGLVGENLVINKALLKISPDDSRIHFYIANALSYSGRKNEIETELHYKRALELNPEFDGARNKYAAYLAKRGRKDEAEKQLQESINKNPNNPKNRIAYAIFLFKEGKFDEAEREYCFGLHTNPSDGWLRNAYAVFLSKRMRPEEAEKEFQTALRIEPMNPIIHETYSAFLINEKRFEEANDQIKTSIDLDPENLRFYKKHIDILIKQGRVDKAEKIYERVISTGKATENFRKSYIKFLCVHAAPEKAEKEFKVAINNNPEDEYVRKVYIKYLKRNHRSIEIEEQLKTGIQACPNKVIFYNMYAVFLARKGRSSEAEQVFKSGIATKSQSISIRRAYIKFLTNRCRFDDAEKQFKEILEFKPMNNKLEQLLFFIQNQREKLDTFATNSTNEDMNEIRYNMFNMALSVDERIEACKTVLAAHPEDDKANYCLGRTLLEKRSDPLAAEPYLRRAVELSPNDPLVRLHYARVLERLERWDEALFESNTLLTILEDNPELYNLQGNCLKELKQWSQAEAAYRKAIGRSQPPQVAKYLNNLALLFSSWPDDSRINEGMKLCDQITEVNPEFQWTSKTKMALSRRLQNDN